MRTPVAFIGWSGSGKTTLIVRLVEYWHGRGAACGVIKHTHHELFGALTGGDTERFLAAGATGAILAGEGEAVLFAAGKDPRRLAFEDPAELTSHLGDVERVFVEGFKRFHGWPRIEVVTGEPSGENVVAFVGEPLSTSHLPQFRPDELEAIASFVDTITAPSS